MSSEQQSNDDAEPGYSPSDVAALKSVLEQVRRIVGGAAQNEVNVGELAYHLAETEESPWTVLREGMLALGHDLKLARYSVREAVGYSSPTTPIVSQNFNGGWIILLGEPAAGQVDIVLAEAGDATVERQTITLDQLARLVNAQGTNKPVDWGVVIPGFAMTEIKSEKKQKRSPVSRLIEMLRPESRDLRTIVVFSLCVGFLGLATPIAVEALVNSVAFGGLLQPVIVLSIVLLISLGFAAALKVYQAWVIELLQRRLFVRLVADLSARLPRATSTAFGSHYPPEMVNRFFDILTVQKVASKLLLSGIAITLSTGVGLIILGFYHPILLAFDLVLVCALFFVLLVMGRNGVKTAIEESYRKYDVADWMQELVRQPMLFKTGTGLEMARDRADKLACAYLDARGKHYSIVFWQLVGSLMLQVLASSMLLGLGGFLVNEQQLTLGQLVASWLIVSIVLNSIAKLGELVESWYDLLAAMDKIGSLTDLKLESRSGTLLPMTEAPASLAVRHVDLSYGSRKIVSDVSFEANAGEVIAVCGPSGSGKSTLLDGLCGLLPPVKGFVEWGGEDLRDINVHCLRQDAAIVRSGFLLKGTLAENVRCERPNITLHCIRTALECVQLLDEFRALSDGLQTQVSTEGRPLSTGQIARLLVARALVGKPRLLLLDGVLDSLDATLRGEILEALRKHSENQIIVLVTANTDLVEGCDKVVDLGAVSN